VKKYKAKGIEVQDNSISPYGTDIESELTKILSEELAKSIDRELIKDLQRLSKPLLRQRKIKKIFND
jgi:hypothetical protein